MRGANGRAAARGTTLRAAALVTLHDSNLRPGITWKAQGRAGPLAGGCATPRSYLGINDLLPTASGMWTPRCGRQQLDLL